MAKLDELEEPTPEEQALIDAATDALEAADELAVVPLVDRDSGDRELFLVAVRHADSDSSEGDTDIQPLGRLCDLDEINDQFSLPEPLAAE